MKSDYFECQCMGDEHTLKFVSDKEDIWISMFLNQYRNIFKRIWIAIKYVFGYNCKYGHWDNWVLRPEDLQRLKQLVCEFEERASSSKEFKTRI